MDTLDLILLKGLPQGRRYRRLHWKRVRNKHLKRMSLIH